MHILQVHLTQSSGVCFYMVIYDSMHVLYLQYTICGWHQKSVQPFYVFIYFSKSLIKDPNTQIDILL